MKNTTTTSIREEIGKVIWKIPCTDAYTVQNYTDTITDIVSIFEKRVDEVFPDGDSLCISREKLRELLK